MRLIKDGPSIDLKRGDPRKWPPGMYRSQRDQSIVIVVAGSMDNRDESTVIAITQLGACSPGTHLCDGYTLLPQGEQIRIEA